MPGTCPALWRLTGKSAGVLSPVSHEMLFFRFLNQKKHRFLTTGGKHDRHVTGQKVGRLIQSVSQVPRVGWAEGSLFTEHGIPGV